MADAKKVSMIAKDLKITGKELIESLKEHGIELKSTASAMTDEQIALAFDVFTAKNMMSEDEIKAEKEAALKAKAVRDAEAEKEAKEEVKPESKSEETKLEKKPEKKAEEKTEAPKAKKPEKTPEPKIVKKAEKPAEPKIVKKAEKPTEPKIVKKSEPEKKQDSPKNEKKKHHNQAKKQGGQKVDLSAISRDDSETIVVQTKEKHRYVDTRTANVDLDALASNERLESFEEDTRAGGRNAKKKEKNNNRFAHERLTIVEP